MRFWAGVTDNRWFEFIRNNKFDEVNFWQPSSRPPFTKLEPGTPFLFKLKSPNHCVAGGGYFVRFTTLPLSMAWDVFGHQNGAASFNEFKRLIQSNASGRSTENPQIGCTVLTGVFFLPEAQWVPMADFFATNIVRGRTYDDETDEGIRLWQHLDHAAATAGIRETRSVYNAQRYGNSFLSRARLGQGAFRTLVTDAYERRCAITGESTLPVLEAAHIKPYADDGPHRTDNGILMRSDFHKLFDLNLVTVEPDYTIRVSSKIRDQWYNGKAYYRLDRTPLKTIPVNSADQPSTEYLRWHNSAFIE